MAKAKPAPKGKRGGDRTLLLYAGGGVAALVVAAMVVRSTSSSSGPSGNTTAADQSIVAANLNALQTQAGQGVATLQAKVGLAETMNQDQTAIAIASHNGASQVELQRLADVATIKAALIGKAEAIAIGAQAESTAKFQAAETLKGTKSTNAASVENTATQARAATLIGKAEALAQQIAAEQAAQASEAQSASQTAVAQANAGAQTTASNNSLWSSIFGGVLGLFGL